MAEQFGFIGELGTTVYSLSTINTNIEGVFIQDWIIIKCPLHIKPCAASHSRYTDKTKRHNDPPPLTCGETPPGSAAGLH